MSELKTTPLVDIHKALGAKMVEFGGFLMPVAYGSIMEEHKAVRERAGIFDVSHMGEFVVTGDGARAFVNGIITNNCAKVPIGGVQYTVMCRENGNAVDDLLVYVLAEDELMLVVNAANIDKDFAHVTSHAAPGVEVRNASDELALIAVQGPLSRDILMDCPFFAGAKQKLGEAGYYTWFHFDHGGSQVMVSRTGYTGELGFEVMMPNALAVSCWEQLLATGGDRGLVPVGLGARDTLRFEASYPLYGPELDDETSPLEAGLGWVVKFKKPPYTGSETLKRQKEEGPARTLIGFELEGRNIARQGYTVLRDGREIGKVTSGGFAPTLARSLGMALVERADAGGAEGLAIDIRGREVPATVVPLPFYKGKTK